MAYKGFARCHEQDVEIKNTDLLFTVKDEVNSYNTSKATLGKEITAFGLTNTLLAFTHKDNVHENSEVTFFFITIIHELRKHKVGSERDVSFF